MSDKIKETILSYESYEIYPEIHLLRHNPQRRGRGESAWAIPLPNILHHNYSKKLLL